MLILRGGEGKAGQRGRYWGMEGERLWGEAKGGESEKK